MIRHEIIGDESRTHGERLPRDLMRALEEAGLTLDAIDLLTVITGPGSFTGLRVGIAAVQGLAMATGRKVVPVSAFEALAVAGGDGTSLVGAWIDAQRGEVFASLYDPDGFVLAEPTSLAPAKTIEGWRPALAGRAVRMTGDGAVRYEAAIAEGIGASARVVPPPPLAGIAGRIAAANPERAVLPHAITPLYVRRSDAELARLRRGQ
jgi:tRNA threonylcarbamoyladenosine biosynthesis protein TsaB